METWALIVTLMSGSGLVGLVGYVLTNERRVSKNEARIASLEARADKNSERWETLELKIDGFISRFEQRLTRVETKLDMVLKNGSHD